MCVKKEVWVGEALRGNLLGKGSQGTPGPHDLWKAKALGYNANWGATQIAKVDNSYWGAIMVQCKLGGKLGILRPVDIPQGDVRGLIP